MNPESANLAGKPIPQAVTAVAVDAVSSPSTIFDLAWRLMLRLLLKSRPFAVTSEMREFIAEREFERARRNASMHW